MGDTGWSRHQQHCAVWPASFLFLSFYHCPSIHVSTCISLCLCLSFSLRVSLPVSLSARCSHLISVSRQGADPEAAPSPWLIVQAHEHQDRDNVTALPYLSYQSHLMIGIVTCVESVEGDYTCMNILCFKVQIFYSTQVCKWTCLVCLLRNKRENFYLTDRQQPQ